MALATTDLGSGAVRRQGYVQPDSDISAECDREFKEFTVKLGGKRLLAIEDDVLLGSTLDDADAFVAALPLWIQLAADDLRSSFKDEFGVEASYLKVLRPRSLGVGDASSEVTIRIGSRLGEMRLLFAAVRVGQVVRAFYFVGAPRVQVGIAEAKRVARATVAHIRATLVPTALAPPSISGTAQVGQVLSVQLGTWLSFPTTFAFQWQRCDATGANCVAITAATAQSYTATTHDVGATLDVVVSAQNSYGAGTATASPSAVVVATPPPPPTP
jgi:hypothetical protein